MKEKPDVLSDELRNLPIWTPASDATSFGIVAQAQRDADVAYYEPIIQQAKAEVARDIFGAFETKFLYYLAHPAGHGREGFQCPKWCLFCEFESLKDKYLKEAA